MHAMMYGGAVNDGQPVKPANVDLRRITKLFAPYWRHEIAVLALMFITAIIGIVPPLLTARIIDIAIPQRDLHLLLLLVSLIVLNALVAAGVAVAQGYLNSIVGESIMRDLRTALVSHLHRMPLSFFTNTKTGEIMNRVSSDVDNVDGVVTGTLTTIITNVLTISTTLVTMFILDWRLALIAIGVTPLMILPLGPVGRKMFAIRKKTREQRDQIESITQETLSISGITLIKSFAREMYERTRFNDTGTRLMKLEIDLAMVGRWFIALIGAMAVIGPALVWFGGGWYAIAGTVTTGTIVAFISLIVTRLYGPTAALAGIQVQVVSALAVFERIFEYLDMKPETYEPSGATTLGHVEGDIRFENVSFGYDDSREILHHLSLHVKPGQVAAFVGPSGGGKTTITQLVPRFYAPTDGAIFIDDHAIDNVSLTSLREAIGIVTQETYLFHDTVAANMRYAKPDATLEELKIAAQAANIDAVISALPLQYETVVGERGHKLSGGERQRLAIARVLLKNPRILILDEATSSLDSQSEALIQAALDTLMRGRTSLVIAHRLSTIVNADIIFVIESGRIIASGTHTELLAQGGLYDALYRTQFRTTSPTPTPA